MINNKIIINGCIERFKEENELDLSDGKLFEMFSLFQIYKDRNLTFENIEDSIVDGSNDGGIDSLMIFIDEEYIDNLDSIENFNLTNATKSKFVISQCKKEKSFKEGVIDKLITTVPLIFDLEKNENDLLTRLNSEVVDKVNILKEVWQKTAIAGGEIFVEYCYVTNASNIETNNAFKSKVLQLEQLSEKYISTRNISFSNYSTAELLEIYQKQKVTRLLIEFKDRPLSVDYGDSGIGYIGTVKLSKYKDFLTSEKNEIRDDLFESNIRHFQGLVDVNKKIKKSIETISTEDFWWLNNGITIIAEEPKEVGKKLSIENVQIVNGLQTSYSIYNSFNCNETDDRSVLVKVIINKNKAITDNIIASTNNQNPVSATLLRATEPIQRDLELFFLNHNYYYDRRKNYYKNQGKPVSKIISIQYMAQSIQTLIFSEPHTARATPTSLLKKEQSYKKIFDDERNFLGYLNCCLINKKTHNFWLKHENHEVKSKTSNFKFHLSLLSIIKLFKSKDITFDQVKDINLYDLTKEHFNSTIFELSVLIDKYLNDNPSTNLVNIAKSKVFTNFILENV